jgi:hypothetical protein
MNYEAYLPIICHTLTPKDYSLGGMFTVANSRFANILPFFIFALTNVFLTTNTSFIYFLCFIMFTHIVNSSVIVSDDFGLFFKRDCIGHVVRVD